MAVTKPGVMKEGLPVLMPLAVLSWVRPDKEQVFERIPAVSGRYEIAIHPYSLRLDLNRTKLDGSQLASHCCEDPRRSWPARQRLGRSERSRSLLRRTEESNAIGNPSRPGDSRAVPSFTSAERAGRITRKSGVPTLATLVLAVALTACNAGATSVEPSTSDSPSIAATSRESTPPASLDATDGTAEVTVCAPPDPLPSGDDAPGVHPPDAMLGSDGTGWEAGEGGSFEWREGNTISEGTGVPAIVPPTATYESAPDAEILRLTLSEPVAIQAWELTYFPWEWYEEDPPAGAESTEWHGTASDAFALCIPAGEPGEYSLTADLDFGEGNHATYRWHVVIPSG
jgi:hypothetical protein